MANVLKREKQIAVVRLLCEGNSIRSTERLTGIHRDTIMRIMLRFGEACRRFLDLSLSNVSVERVELDEVWTFCRKKQGHLSEREKDDPTIGDIYLFTGICADTKLLIHFELGKRNQETTDRFVSELERRIVRPPISFGSDRPQISTDGFPAYPGSIGRAFGQTVRHGVLIKNYANPESGRYAPPDLCSTARVDIEGIDDLATICTSHVERHNLTIRTFMKRFSRLALGFSKRFENLCAATAIFIAYYNFCWRTRMPGKTGCRRPTAAMMAGLTGTLWTVENLYDAVMGLEQDRRSLERYKRLGRKLRGDE